MLCYGVLNDRRFDHAGILLLRPIEQQRFDLRIVTPHKNLCLIQTVPALRNTDGVGNGMSRRTANAQQHREPRHGRHDLTKQKTHALRLDASFDRSQVEMGLACALW